MKGIMFKPDMVLAIVEGRKTQTRRVIKQAPYLWLDGKKVNPQPDIDTSDWIKLCPYGQVGDRLWVRESWCENYDGSKIHYKADGKESPGPKGFWRPSIFMPRWASRITLEITEVRIERVQEITEEDSIGEGCTLMVGTTVGGNMGLASARYSFMKLWDSINAKRGYSWENNPWVWVISFGKLK